MKSVLLITDTTQRYYWQPFVEACDQNFVSVYIFDTSRFPSEATISIAMDDLGRIVGSIDVESPHHDGTKLKRLDIAEIDTAWYLRAERIIPPPYMSELEAQFTQDEATGALDALLAALDCVWVNRVDTIRFVESSKFYQQSVASRCGLNIPRTLITNDPEQAIRFSRETNGVLLKPTFPMCS